MTQRTDKPAPGALEIRDRMAGGEITARAVVEDCLAGIEAREAEIEAWQHLDPTLALRRAEALDQRQERGLPLGPLHGAPIGVKDIIDTADMPTANGSPIDAGRRPQRDATVVTRLRNAGAVLIGKTVSTEFAYFHPGKTKNPHDPARTPGGSSSGSAAAVAAGMVPVAIGTQTNGSVNRPAAFCGVVGFKPSFGRIPRTGLLSLSATLDHVGVFARSVEDAALVAETLFGADGEDPLAPDCSGAGLLAAAQAEPPRKPLFAFVKQPAWSRAEQSTQEAFGALKEALGDQVEEAALPPLFDEAEALHGVVMACEMAHGLGSYVDRAPDQVSDKFKTLVEHGRSAPAQDYLRAKATRGVLIAGLKTIFERYDAIITPSAPGEAPVGLGATGDPCFCTLWSYTGPPTINLPLMRGPAGLPLGVQLVGAPGDDARLLRTARWLTRFVEKKDR